MLLARPIDARPIPHFGDGGLYLVWCGLLAFYATPSTDAASSLPAAQAGSGSGIYKMASSLGAAFGVAISAAIFTALSADNSNVRWLEGVISFVGRHDNLAVREAAIVALMFNLFMIVVAIASIMLTVPKIKRQERLIHGNIPHCADIGAVKLIPLRPFAQNIKGATGQKQGESYE